jgi:hypothetical protein
MARRSCADVFGRAQPALPPNGKRQVSNADLALDSMGVWG